MSKNQFRGMASETVPADVDSEFGRPKVPLKAASRLKGTVLLPRNDGGSIRVYGADTLRGLLARSARFALGDLPAGAVRGALGDDELALLVGVKAKEIVGGGMLDAGEGLGKVKAGVVARTKAGLEGVLSLHLLFLVGDKKMEGSTFSPSSSS